MLARRCAAALAAVLVLVACGGDDGDDGAVRPLVDATATTSTTTTSTTTTTTSSVADGRPYEVDRSDVVLEDTSRPTDAAPARRLAARPSRTLPVLLLVPVGDGPFPVLVFAHGVTASGPAYEPVLRRIAAAGYVVAAPTFPLSSGEGGTVGDYVNQPGDVYFVLDTLLARAEDPVDELYGLLDPDRIALGGHSLGAMTTVGAVFNSCCADPRVDAAIVLSGIEAPFGGGTFDDRPGVPLLLGHGERDGTIAVEGSERLFASATGPVAFVRFPGAGHSDILANQQGDVLTAAMVAWLDAWLLDDAEARDALSEIVDGSGGVATLEQREG